jgi:arginyl-tRNA synthetase
LEDILNESTEVMHGVMRSNAAKYAQLVSPEETAAQLALSAIVIQDFSAKRIKDYDFQWSRMTSFEGDTGPYLQYTHARLSSIIKKALEAQKEPAATLEDNSFEDRADSTLASLDTELPLLLKSPDYDLIVEPAAHKLVLHLLKFPQIVQDACRTHEPCLVVTYLMALCHSLSSLLESLYVLNQPKSIQAARLALYGAARIVLANGITLLGLKPLAQM